MRRPSCILPTPRARLVRGMMNLSCLLVLSGAGLACSEGPVGPAGLPGETGTPGPTGPTGPLAPGGRSTLFLTEVGRFGPNGAFDESAAEITAFDRDTQQVFVVNGDTDTIVVFNVLDPTPQTETATIVPTSVLGGSPTSVAVGNGVVAVAVERPGEDGLVAFLNAAVPTATISVVPVGALPDMVTFTPDGSRVLVANEGEPFLADDNGVRSVVNPVGSISIIEGAGGDFRGLTAADVIEVGFEDFNVGGAREDEFPPGIRNIFPGATRAQELEPESIAVSDDGSTAYVTLQEHNALAIIQIIDDDDDGGTTATVTAILDLGEKNFLIPGNEFDASDQDFGVNLRTWPVFGLYQPDAIDAYTAANGRTYLVTANEGDAVDYTFDTGTATVAIVEESRLEDLTLDPAVFPNAAELQAPENLGRLLVPNTAVDGDGDELVDRIVAFGGRSFSIWDGETGALVFDSGNDFERITAVRLGADFNADNDENGGDARSDAKGPEPEGIVVGQIGDRSYAFIGLERVGGIMVYDVTQPESPDFVQYVNNRDFSASQADLEAGLAGDLGPEGLTFVSSGDSASGLPLLLVGNEVSGTTTLYEITVVD